MGQEAQLSQRDLRQLGYSTLSGLSSFPKSQKTEGQQIWRPPQAAKDRAFATPLALHDGAKKHNVICKG